MSDGWDGEYRGIIQDNNDPQKQGRCRLIVSEVLGHSVISGWAEPAVMIVGKSGDWGECNIPPVGAIVWVRFVHGYVDKPVYGKGYSPAPNAEYHLPNRALGVAGSISKGTRDGEPGDPFAATYPNNRVFQTPGGHLLEFDDTPGGERIHIWHKAGAFLEIHPDGTIVTVTPGNLYTAADGSYTLRAASADIKIVGLWNLQAGSVRETAGTITETAGTITNAGQCVHGS